MSRYDYPDGSWATAWVASSSVAGPLVDKHIRGPSPCSCGGTRAVTADQGRSSVRAACAACTAERLADLEAEVRLMKSLIERVNHDNST